MSASEHQPIYEFGGFYLDTAQRLLFRVGGERVALTSRAFDTLTFMVEHQGELLDTGRLMNAIWPNITVEENNLQQIITALRRALGEKPDDHRFIVTSRGRGYRFVAPVHRLQELPAIIASPDREKERGRRRAGTLALAASLAVMVIAVSAFGAWVAFDGGTGDQERSSVVVSAVPSIAVLPFADLSPRGDQAYFSHGIAEELLNQLARLDGLRVAGRTSSFSFDGSDTDLRAIRETLGVGNILQGSVRKDGNRVRITAQLVSAADGYQLWSKTFERELGDIFTIQDEIARAVAGALSIALDIDARNRLQGTGTRNFEAYDSYLAAMESLRSGTDLQQAVIHLDRAIELDPDYTAAWAALALAHGQLSWRGVGEEPSAMLERLDVASQHAVALDPDLADGHVMRGQYHVSRDQWSEAEREFKKAMTLSNTAQPAGAYATLLARTGRLQPALAYMDRALDMDPLHTLNIVWRALIWTAQGRYAEALGDVARCEELGYPKDSVEGNRLIILLNAGTPDQVRRQFGAVAQLGTFEAPFLQSLLTDFDSPERAVAGLRDVYADKSVHGPGTRSYIGLLAAYFGDPHFALQVISEEVRETALRTSYLWFPVFADMRRLPEFKALVRELNLVDYWREFGWPDACHPVGTDDFACG